METEHWIFYATRVLNPPCDERIGPPIILDAWHSKDKPHIRLLVFDPTRAPLMVDDEKGCSWRTVIPEELNRNYL